jgi:hypothetical protein
MGRTVRDFTIGIEVASVVDSWANKNEFDLLWVDDEGTRTYQRGKTSALRFVEHLAVRQWGVRVHLEAWIGPGLVPGARVGSPARFANVLGEMPDWPLEPGFSGRRSRRLTRAKVNELLVSLGQPPIR